MKCIDCKWCDECRDALFEEDGFCIGFVVREDAQCCYCLWFRSGKDKGELGWCNNLKFALSCNAPACNNYKEKEMTDISGTYPASGTTISNCTITTGTGPAIQLVQRLGGDRCHLCASKLVSHDTVRTLRKKVWDTTEIRIYSCGTMVEERLGKKKNFVTVGKGCIKFEE